MFKPQPDKKESAQVIGNKLIIKSNKNAQQARAVKPKKLKQDTQKVLPSVATSEEPLFEIY